MAVLFLALLEAPT